MALVNSSSTIRQILASTNIEYLNDTKVLLKFVLNYSTADLMLNQDYTLSQLQQKVLTKYLVKLALGVPVAHILGFKEFYSLKFKVNNHVLIPRPETEHLVDYILNYTHNSPEETHVLDLGTGSGCIAISLVHNNPKLRLTASDISLDALSVAKANAQLHHSQIEFIHSNWFDKILDKFHIIVSNPPYIAINDRHLIDLKAEPLHALSDMADGLQHYKTIIAQAREHLHPNGALILEHGYNQSEEIVSLLKVHNYTNISTHVDYANIPRYISANYSI